jgi:hypothetical protein
MAWWIWNSITVCWFSSPWVPGGAHQRRVIRGRRAVFSQPDLITVIILRSKLGTYRIQQPIRRYTPTGRLATRHLRGGRQPPRVRLPASGCARSLNGCWHGSGSEEVELVVAVMEDAVAGLRYLVPGAGQVAERLGHDQPGLLGEIMQEGVVGVQVAQGMQLGVAGTQTCSTGSWPHGGQGHHPLCLLTWGRRVVVLRRALAAQAPRLRVAPVAVHRQAPPTTPARSRPPVAAGAASHAR